MCEKEEERRETVKSKEPETEAGRERQYNKLRTVEMEGNGNRMDFYFAVAVKSTTDIG